MSNQNYLTFNGCIMQKVYILILMVLVSTLTSINRASAEDKNLDKYGFYGGWNLNIHSPDFYNLRSIPNCCPEFKTGFGMGPSAGFLYEYHMKDNYWIGARLGIMSLDGLLKKEETTTVNTLEGSRPGAFEHRIDGSFFNVGLEPTFIYSPYKNLFLNIGARLGVNLTYTFHQVEEIVKPDGYATFLNEDGTDSHSRTRNEFDGDIPDAVPFQMALKAGVSYEMPLSPSGVWSFAPELDYYYNFTELVENKSWTIHTMKLGVAVKYNPEDKKPKEVINKKDYRIDTLKIQKDIIAGPTFKKGKELIDLVTEENSNQIIKTGIISRTDTFFVKKNYELSGEIVAVGVGSNGKEIENPQFTIEEFISNRLDPLLNYVFFDEQSSELPKRYDLLSANEIDNFEIDSLYRDTPIEIYRNILNIIGKRLKENPEAQITLFGYNDGNIEKNNIKLSENRAVSIKNYLTDVWGISSKRITVKSGNLPEKASTPLTEQDKMSENRRVEIFANNDKILEPVFIEKIDRTSNPPIVRFKLKTVSEAGLKKWEVTSYQNSNKEEKFIATGNELTDFVDWALDEDQKIIPRKKESLLYNLKLTDKKGNNFTTENKTKPVEVITVKQKRSDRVGDYEIEKFSLILFDFDKSTIDEKNKKIIEFIKSRTKGDSEIEIYGYTDRTGDAEHNATLSQNRANSVKNALNLKNVTAQGIGEEKLIYNNDSP